MLFILTTCPYPCQVSAESYRWPTDGSDVVGQLRRTVSRASDTLMDIGRHFDIGHQQIVRANPDVDIWLPGDGTSVLIPSQTILPQVQREGVVINIPEMRLYFFNKKGAPGDWKIEIFPIGIGRMGWTTPLGLMKISAKIKDPIWYPPASIRTEYAAKGKILARKVLPGPHNPLGKYALRLGTTSYLIHGTNKSYGVGMRISHGCIRMYPEDIESLYKSVKRGVSVRIIDQPYKAGWLNDQLLFEAHPALRENKNYNDRNWTPAIQAVLHATRQSSVQVAWADVVEAARQADGFPHKIGAERTPSRQSSPVSTRHSVTTVLTGP